MIQIMKVFSEKTKLSFFTFIKTVLLTIFTPQKGPIFANFNEALKQFPNALTIQQLFTLFRNLDIDKNGFVGYSELIRYLFLIKDK